MPPPRRTRRPLVALLVLLALLVAGYITQAVRTHDSNPTAPSSSVTAPASSVPASPVPASPAPASPAPASPGPARPTTSPSG